MSMKNNFKILFLLLLLPFLGFSQNKTFNLISSTFEEGAIFCPRPNIQFKVNKATILPNSFPLLDSIVNFLKIHNEIVLIEIGGHLDYSVSEACSSHPSQQRAQSIANYLIQNGIEKERIKTMGYGEEIPLVPNDTPKNKMLNRRIEFKILIIKKE